MKGVRNMDFYITDRQFNLQTIVSTENTTIFKVAQATDELNLETPSRRLELALTFLPSDSKLIKSKVRVGYYVLYVDKNGDYVWQTIMEVTHNPLSGLRTLKCEDASLDLLNELVPPTPSNGAHNIKYYIEKFTYDSGFSIGVNEIPNLTRTLEWDSESTALERIQSVATQFDNAEIKFSFEFRGNQLVKRNIDIYKKRGRDTEYKLYVNKDINYIETSEDIYQLVNAIKPVGGTPEGKDTPIDLSKYSWTDPTGRFVLDKGIVFDTENVKMWSRTNTVNNFFLQYKTWTTTSQKDLLDTTIRWLKQYSTPIEKYTVDIANLPHRLELGDYISIVDENEELFLRSRVKKLTYDYSVDTIVAELSDFTKLDSGISSELQRLANEFQNTINSSIPYIVNIETSAPFFVNGEGTITMSATVTKGNLDVTNLFNTFTWTRLKLDGSLDTAWSATGREITITADNELRYTYIVDAKDN